VQVSRGAQVTIAPSLPLWVLNANSSTNFLMTF